MPRNKTPSAKEKKFAQGVAAGKTDKQAALDAGYTLSMSENSKQRIWSKPEVQEYFRNLMRTAAPPERIVQKISDHIDGKSVTTKIRKRMVPSSDPEKKGEEVEETVIEKIETVDAGVSLRACEMAVEYGEYVPAKGAVAPEIGVTFQQALIMNGDSWEVRTWRERMSEQ